MLDDDDDDADGASQRCFQSFTSMEELSEYLGVPVKALYCVQIKKNKQCKKPNCIYPVLEKNPRW